MLPPPASNMLGAALLHCASVSPLLFFQASFISLPAQSFIQAPGMKRTQDLTSVSSGPERDYFRSIPLILQIYAR